MKPNALAALIGAATKNWKTSALALVALGLYAADKFGYITFGDDGALLGALAALVISRDGDT